MIVVGLERDGLSKIAGLGDDVQKAYREGLTRAGFFLEGKVVRKIDSNISPKLHPQTVKKKGSSKALVDSGEMRSEVTSKGSLGGDVVEVGVFGGRAGIADVHEFGKVINVTPKMRGYLNSIGIHLKKSTTKIIIPERSFLRSTAREEKDKVLGIVAKKIDTAIKNK